MSHCPSSIPQKNRRCFGGGQIIFKQKKEKKRPGRRGTCFCLESCSVTVPFHFFFSKKKRERRRDLGDEWHVLFGVMFGDNAVPPSVIRCIVHPYARPRGYLRFRVYVCVCVCVCVCVRVLMRVSLSLSLSTVSGGLGNGDGIDI